MQRTTVMAPDEVVDRLKRLARERGVPFSVVVREALEDKAGEYRPRPTCFGIGQSSDDAAPIDWDAPVPPPSWR